MAVVKMRLLMKTKTFIKFNLIDNEDVVPTNFCSLYFFDCFFDCVFDCFFSYFLNHY